MGNIADQLLVFLIILHLFCCRFLKADPHLLKVLAELSDLIVILHLKREIQISIPYILGGCLKPSQGTYHRPVYPHHKDRISKYDDHNDGRQHFRHHDLDLWKKTIHIGNNEYAPLVPIRVHKIHLLYQMLCLPIQINSTVNVTVYFLIFGKLVIKALGDMAVPVKNQGISLSDDHIVILCCQILIKLFQKIRILKLPWVTL